jgi:hypothetical protein
MKCRNSTAQNCKGNVKCQLVDIMYTNVFKFYLSAFNEQPPHSLGDSSSSGSCASLGVRVVLGGTGRMWLHDAALATGAAWASLHRMSFFLGFQIDTLTPLLPGPPGSGHGSRRGRR